ncbi:cullin-associated NEDD8-dissociated protein [Plectosphaerella cucumerina]|uniref:Cullin-associated NEDD8-dissociated protein n=1 Tax=Plectosphaerella cucumerina TaxID=40658 RepID=A0A8K0TJV5_9PEZI|nr:cullin-associated NEDD8-dissociated protein [Plectosphaerella cucumerina]
MASTTLPPTAQSVLQLVNKLSEADPDYRYMALTDMISLFDKGKHDFLHHDYNAAARTVDAIIKTLDDQNGEVQNLAIKCLGPLVAKIPSSIVGPMLEKLSTIQLKNSVDNAVPALALRTAIMALPRPIAGVPPSKEVLESYKAVSRVLIPRLIGPGERTQAPQTPMRLPTGSEGLLQSDKDLSAEAVDVLIEVVRSFGPLLMAIEVEALQDAVINILENDRGSSVVQKRAVVAVSILSTHLSSELLAQTVSRMASVLSKPKTTPVTRRLYLSIVSSVARSIPARFGAHVHTLAPHIFLALGEKELAQHLEDISGGDDLGLEFNDVREAALIALEAFLTSCPTEMEPFTDDTISSCLRFIKYDPNLAMDDDDDDEMDDEDDDDEMDEDDDAEVDEFDDDDDASWKVRRCAAKALHALISTRGQGKLLHSGVLYNKAGPALVKKFDEREENVRLEIISCVALLVRKTGEDLYPGYLDWSLDNNDDESPNQLPVNRKRRRQSSVVEPVSPVLAKAPATGPFADLVRLTPSIIKASSKHLKGKAIPTKQAIFDLFDDVVKVQRGGLADYLNDIVGPVIDAMKATGSSGFSSSMAAAGGNASATPGTLRVASLRLISDVAKTHPSNVLQPHLPQLVAGVLTAVNDRFYKISCDAIRTVEEIVKNITPPRSKLNAAKFKTELQKLFDTVMDRISQPQADAEVRQRAIQALGVLLARTSSAEGAGLISPENRRAASDVLLDRLRNETTRLSAVRAIDNVAAFTTSPGQLDAEWIQQVATELSGQLRKSHRGLRTSSIQALKHLVISPSCKGKLQPDTIQSLVTALSAVISGNDTYLLAPALVILAQLVEENPTQVVTKSTTDTLCNLLKSTSASVALEQLLALVTEIGKSGTGQPLMMGLLQSVSLEGDPVIVGKVIGTLLVFSGDSAGVTIESFVSELQTSSQRSDDARASLALAILGEAGLRLGSKSPLKPELFLEQFHEEPDKASISAAIALGRAGAGNVSQYLPVILETMKRGGNTQYLLIQSIKEILQQVPIQSINLSKYAEPLWKQLLAASTNTENAVVSAECVGRLVIVDPKVFMPELQSLLGNENHRIRGMAIQAVRYTLPDSDDALDATLKEVLLDMLLTMLQDPSIHNRRLALSTLNSATHNKPDIVLTHLDRLMPFVLSESQVKKELIREVQMGPFKHLVDDGIEVRKSAYEMLYALMETAYSRINKVDLFDRVVAGLRDESDIRALCNLMVTKLVDIDTEATLRRLDPIADAYRAILSVKLKEGSVKQDVEKQEEALRSALRVSLLLADRLSTAGIPQVSSSSPVWANYWEWAAKDHHAALRGLREESEGQRVKST